MRYRLRTLLIVLALGPMVLTAVWTSAASAQVQAASQPMPTELERTATIYKIDIAVKELVFPVSSRWGMIDGKAANKGELESYARIFVPEFRLYPPDLIQRSKLKRVSLCTDLSFDGQRRNAIPDYEHNTLYLDVSRGKDSTPYLRKVIHHEFFHIIDYRDDGRVYGDESWRVINQTTIQYGGGGRAAQDLATTSVLTTKLPGFLNHYSTTGVEEDKAEVFANLIVELEYVELRAKDDSVLQAKIKRMKELLKDFCLEMDDTFWERVRKLDRSNR